MRQKEIISLYNEVAEGAPQEQIQKYQIETTFPEESCKYMYI